MQLSTVFISLALAIASASAGPLLHKRIAQDTIQAPTPWENACLAAGGGEQCNPVAVSAAAQLLAGADPCGQQNAADTMIDIAKSLNGNQPMIAAAQLFVQQPRNEPNSKATDYCQQAPRNQELNGLFQCQFEGADENNFASGATVGQSGTIPFGLSAPVNPPGSCPALNKPVPDGQQISDIVSSPGIPAASSASGSTRPPSSAGNTTDSSGSGDSASNDPASSINLASSGDSGASGASGTPSNNFQLDNGRKAQQQNAEFAQLAPGSSCTDGDQACINGQFAQCVGGKFVSQACAATLQCYALPLVDKSGTSIACDTPADAASRIAATGATGGVAG